MVSDSYEGYVRRSGGKGRPRLVDVPDPVATAGHVVIATEASVTISAGTEEMVCDLARKSLLQKARDRPGQVRRVLEKLRQEGPLETVRQVRGKLSEPVPLGYSSVGRVLAYGTGVQGVRPGDRVASNGPHAEIVSVHRNLCEIVPYGVPTDHAAFGILGAIAMQGLRLSELRLGETALVIGLGLLGQITTSILKAAGVRVIGTDLDASRCELALRMGAAMARTGLGGSEASYRLIDGGKEPFLYSLVPRARVLVVAYDDFRDDSAEEYSRVLGFLGLAPDEHTDFPQVKTHQRLTFPVAARPLHWARMLKLNLGIRRSLGIWRLASSHLSRPDHRPALDPELREEMAEFFRDDSRISLRSSAGTCPTWLVHPRTRGSRAWRLPRLAAGIGKSAGVAGHATGPAGFCDRLSSKRVPHPMQGSAWRARAVASLLVRREGAPLFGCHDPPLPHRASAHRPGLLELVRPVSCTHPLAPGDLTRNHCAR